MEITLNSHEINRLKEVLKNKHIKISTKEIMEKLNKIEDSQQVFPTFEQKAMLVQLLFNYEHSRKKEVIILDELREKQIPATIVLGILAEDWPGMSNSILGIVHHKERNVLYVQGFTVAYKHKAIGVVILAFKLDTRDEYEEFLLEKKELITRIKEASQGSTGKYLLLEDETKKFEIYNEVTKKINKLVDRAELIKEIEESSEALKFVSSRSREYLEERKPIDLAQLIIDNYDFQKMIRTGCAQEAIKIKNFKTKYEHLTGITFVCKENLFSIEDFLKMLDFIVPNHIIMHHKSFVTIDGILVYRLEIVDQNGNPLSLDIIKSIEKSIVKLITISCSEEFTKLKSVGGFEHYARAIIPFLIEELKRTKEAQVFINVDKKTEFLINIKLIIVSIRSTKKRIYDLISRLSLVGGIDINSTIPTKIYGDKIEVNILNLKVNLAEFKSIKDIYTSLKKIIKKLYGDIRDFDEGFREMYIKILNQLLDKLDTVDSSLIRDIFFSIDELYRIEIQPNLLLELIKLCSSAVADAKREPGKKIIVKYKNVTNANRTIFVLSYEEQRKLLSKLVQKLKDVSLYFTKIEWNQRIYLLMILSQNNKALGKDSTKELKEMIKSFALNP